MSSTYSQKVSPSRVRKPDETDTSRICCQLKVARDRVDGTEITRDTDLEYITAQIVDHEVDSVIVDNAFLVVYDIGEPWYVQKTVLRELMVLRIGEGSSFNAVCDLLDDIAEFYECTDILVGTALAKYPRALVRKYQARGYSLLGNPSLIKRR